jgi:predicted molibdopterin-dependent oxidoreductase YjgC
MGAVKLAATATCTSSARAAVALPVRTYLEKSGTFTNSRGLEQAFRAVVEPTFEAWTEKEALAQIAAAAGLD